MAEPFVLGRYFEDFVAGEALMSAGRTSILIEDCRLVNQRGEMVLSGQHALMVRRRPA